MFVEDAEFRAIVVEELLTAGAEVDARGGYLSKTPLLTAMSERHLDSAERLLKAGADPNVVDDLEMTPLIWAANSSPEAVRLLLAHGVDIKHVGPHGGTALHWTRSTESARLLIAAGIPVDDQRSDDSTRLIRAVVDGDREMVACLLELGADPTRQHGTWGSAIDTARVRGDQAMLDLLRGASRPDEPKFGGLLGK
jgi:ankyrin repeat protein